jgi:hypothetical protein
MICSLITAATAFTLAGVTPPDRSRIEGDYVESRTADVFTGPCFANAQVFITGHQAVMAWKVTQGSWEGVDLAGLSVAAAVRGTTTFSKDEPGQAESVVMVDESATPEQRRALLALAKELGGERLSRIVAVEPAKMNVFVESHEAESAAHETENHHARMMPQAPRGSFWAAGLAEITTRPLDGSDHLCGNEVIEYPPLSRGVSAQPAYTLSSSFKGQGLGTRWDEHNNRGSFVGHFSY